MAIGFRQTISDLRQMKVRETREFSGVSVIRSTRTTWCAQVIASGPYSRARFGNAPEIASDLSHFVTYGALPRSQTQVH